MPAIKQCKDDTDISKEQSCRKILTLSGLKDRKEHKNRIFTSESREDSFAKDDRQ